MGLIRNVFPPQVHPLKKCCNTQTSVKFDKTSISNNLCSWSSAFTLFPPFSLHTDRYKKSKHITFKSTSLGGFVTLFSSERNFFNNTLGINNTSWAALKSTGAAVGRRNQQRVHPEQRSWLWPMPPNYRSLNFDACSQLRVGPKEVSTVCTIFQKSFWYFQYKSLLI